MGSCKEPRSYGYTSAIQAFGRAGDYGDKNSRDAGKAAQEDKGKNVIECKERNVK